MQCFVAILLCEANAAFRIYAGNAPGLAGVNANKYLLHSSLLLTHCVKNG
jgi:hypothetical protein